VRPQFRPSVLFGQSVLALVLYCAVAALVTWPQAPQAGTSVPDTGDPAESIWTLHWIAQAITHDPAHLYAAPIFHGFPNALAYDDTSLLPGVLFAPLWLTDARLLGYNVLMLATLALIGFTAFLLIRRVSGSAVAGGVGGLLGMVNSYTLAHLSHLNVLSAYLLPLGLLALYESFHPGVAGPSRRAAAGLAAVLIGQATSTFYVFAYLALAVAAYVLWQGIVVRALWRWPAAWRRRLARQGLAVAAATGLALAVLLPPYLETQRVLGFARTAGENAAWAAHPLDYLSVSLHNRSWTGRLPENNPEPLFPGFVALALMALGGLVAVRRRVAETGFYAALLGGALLLTLGPALAVGNLAIPLPYAWLAALPGAAALRAPVRAVALVYLAGGLFVGLGARAIADCGLRIADWRRGAERTPLPPRPTEEKGETDGRERRLYSAIRNPQSAIRNPQSAIGKLWPAGVLGVLGGLMVWEQQVAPLVMAPLPVGIAALPAAYRWLAAHPDGGVLIELPVGLGLRDPTVEGRRMYLQGWHGHPLVNGYSSFRPPTYVEMLTALDRQYSQFTPAQVGTLQSLDVRYLLFHTAAYKKSAWEQLLTTLDGSPALARVGRFPAGPYGDDYLYALAARPADVRLALALGPAAGGATAVTFHNPYAYPLLARLRPTLDLARRDGSQLAIPAPLLIAPGTYTMTVPGATSPAAVTGLLDPAPPYLVLAVAPPAH